MVFLRGFWRLFLLAIHLGCGLVLAALALPVVQRQQRASIIRWWSVRVLRILHVRLEASGIVPPQDLHGAMFVANHISWLDIWAINAVKPMRFISKAEVRDWPIIGWLAEQTGTIFIERARRRDTSRVSGAGTSALLEGDCVCVFPEGTTTYGTCMRPFKSSLLQAAVDADALVWPLVVSYPRPDGEPDTGVSYADDITMAQSLREVLSRKEILVRLNFAAPVRVEGRTRRELAYWAETLISSSARLPVHEEPETASDLQGAPQ